MTRLICCVILFIGTGCVRDLPGLLPSPPAQLVLWSEIRAGEPFEAYLGRTFPIEGVEPDSLWLTDGIIEVWEEDSLGPSLTPSRRALPRPASGSRASGDTIPS